MSVAAAEAVAGVRRNLGRVGIWLGRLSVEPAAVEREFVAEFEGLGFGSVWISEVSGNKDVFAHAGILLAGSSRIVVGSGIANIWAREGATSNGGANALGEAYPGRFVLGLGASHGPVVGGYSRRYERPFSAMREHLDAMDAVDYRGPSPKEPVLRVLAALRPRMLELARDRAAGAHPYFVPVEHTELARKILGPEPLLIPEQAVVLDTGPESARATARDYMARYLRLPNYTNNLRALGWGDEDLVGGGSDRLVDAIVAWGDVDAVKARVDAHHAAGADHVVVQPLGPALTDATRQLRELAPALLGT